jgi:hypothetical protein
MLYHGRVLLLLLASVLMQGVTSTPVLLTVQTQSAERMHAITHPELGQRQLLTFEATQTGLVDVNEQYVATRVQSVPTLSLLDNIVFDNETEVWTFSYETMAVDDSSAGQINHYYRVLYLTRAGHAVGSSDTSNPCLNAGTSFAECMHALREDYVVLESPASAQDSTPRDRIETTSWTCLDCPGSATKVETTLLPHPFSATQTLRLEIPHSVIRTALARLRNSTRADSVAFAELGTQPALDFGIGMMFLPQPDANTQASPPNNMLIFDMFTVLENTFEQLAIMKQTSYSVATHVAFWTAAAQTDSRIRVVSIEYLLDLGHVFTDVKVSVNNGSLADGGSMVPITPADCAAMQALVDVLPDARCIAQKPLCTPTRYVEGSGASLQTWATVVFPIPEWHTGGDFQFNTLIFSNLTTAHGGRGMQALSTLNFFTSHAPRVACQPAETVAFDATRHVRAELYRGHLLASEQIQGTFTVFNDSSLSSAEALVTLVLRPDDSAEALEYFQTYTDERLRLDELYMSHGKISHVFPSTVANSVLGAGNGRSTLQLDAELAARCPLEGAPEVGLCVTTKDWTLQGQQSRPGSSVFYVRQVSGLPEDEDADVAWLAANVFGPSDPAALSAFRTATLTRPFSTPAAQARKQYAAVFWVWPVFSWPNTAPVGLVDKTIVSMAWSIAP